MTVMKRCAIIICVLAMLAVVSCKRQTEFYTGPSEHVVPLYSLVRDYSSLSDSSRAELLEMPELEAFMKTVSDLPLDSDLVQSWSESAAVTIFTPAVDSVFTDTSIVGRALGCVLARAKEQGIALPQRRYASVVYGRVESVLFVDSVMLVALNHYLGADYPGYSHWPEYMRSVKNLETLPCDLAEALVATEYPYTSKDGDATLLSKMLYYGVLAHVRQQLGNSTVAVALGYSVDQMVWLEENEEAIWTSIVADKLLYDTSTSVSDKMLLPSPSVNIVRPNSPGRVGRYIGYKLVERYLKKHPETLLSTLLLPEYYNSVVEW